MKKQLNKYKANEIIKIIRQNTKLTQEEFAKKINKSRHTVQSYELGRNKMSLDTFLETINKFDLKITIKDGEKND